MKKLITNYAFDASNKTVTFNDYTSISLPQVLLITNINKGTIIYNFAQADCGASVSGNVLTLEYDTTSMSDTDNLQIWYDDLKYQKIDTNGNLAVVAYKENPSNTAYGQEVVSIAETYHSRQLREGNRKTIAYNGSVIPASGAGYAYRDFGKPDSGYILYPRFIQFKPTVECMCMLKLKTGIASANIIYLLNRKVSANESVVVSLDQLGIVGEYVQVGTDYGVELQIISTDAAGTLDGCSYGVQVAANG